MKLTAEYIKEYVTMPDVLSMVGVNAEKSPIPCPIHGGKNKKFYFTNESYICFSKCGGEGGDIFNFVMRYYNTDFNGAKRLICDYFGLGENNSKETQNALKKAKELRIQRKIEQDELKAEWLKWLNAFTWCDKVLMGKPDMSDSRYVKALKNIDYAWYRLQEAEYRMRGDIK